MKPGTEHALEFLQRLYPTGIWALTAIQPDKKSIETRSFTDPEACAKWVEKYNGKRNIYFHVNQPKELLSKKATKEDISAAYFFHVDIDPRAGEKVDEEQARIKALIEEWPYDLPEPHITIFSGGGFQLFWRLEKKFEIGGDVELAEDFERYNKTIEQTLDADNCHNVDRIMRLPGTLNIPDETKMKKGRVPVEAQCIDFNVDGTIPLEAITPVPKVQDAGDRFGGGGNKVKISGNVDRISDLEELDKYGVNDYVKIVIAQGSLPPEDCNEKQAHFSRSDWVFKVLCDLIRHEVPDDVMFSIITDPDWPISEHVFAQKGDPEKYAIRQIEQAHDHAVDPMLQMFNNRYAVIKNLGGKCLVVEELVDEINGRGMLSKIQPHNFNLAWANRVVQIGQKNDGSPVYKPAGKWWFEHPLRREFDRLIFSPGHEVSGAYNLWRGFAVTPKAGDCSLFLNHVRDNICSGNEEHYEYLISWMARAVQYPAKSGQAAIILRGKQGTGKSFFVKGFGSLFGRHFLQVADAKHLVGSFNAHLRDCVILFGDEAFYAGDRKHESVLKTLVTEETLHYEAKGVDSEQGRNFVHLIMASNSDWVVPADMDDRRFLVLDVSPAHATDSKYFGAIAEQLDNGGREALLLFLMQYDIEKFQVRNVPKTDALMEQKLLSLEPLEEWWFQKLQTGQLLEDDDHPWDKPIIKTRLCDDYIQYVRDYGVSRRGNQTVVGKFLNKSCPDNYPRSKKIRCTVRIPTPDGFEVEKKQQLYHYIFPPLADCRKHWEDMMQTEFDWPSIEPVQEEIDDPDKIPF